MVLIFGDTHIGYKFYNDSFNIQNFSFPTEEDAFNALDEIHNRASKDDIEMLICVGDVFHTPTPTTKNISRFLSWLKKISKLNKPLYIITGNHDVSLYSNSLVYLHQFNLDNIYLIDTAEKIGTTTKYYDWTIVFVPYVIDPNTVDKDYLTRTSVHKFLTNAISEKQIIVSHIQEASCVRGSENILLAHSTPVVSLDEYTTQSILITGHIHYGQIYSKKNSVVIYPGNMYPMDFSDVNQVKTYVLFAPDGSYKIEDFKSVRKFKSIQIPESVDNVIDYLSKVRLVSNSVYFVLVSSKHRSVDRKSLKAFFESRNCYLGDVRTVNLDTESLFSIDVPTNLLQESSYSEIFSTYINNLDLNEFKLKEKDRPSLISMGLSYLEESI